MRGSLAVRLADVVERLDGAPVDVDRVGREIGDVLSDPAYLPSRPSLLERLLGPVYDWIERLIAWVFDKITDVIRWLFELFENEGVRRAAPIVVLVVAAVGAAYLARRRARDIERRSTIERILEIGTDPTELESLADIAENTGDHAEAIRLRFVAGLLRLDAAGRIEFYPGLSSATISERLAEPGFDRLAEQFDRVVYGRKPASADDAGAARSDWALLLGART